MSGQDDLYSIAEDLAGAARRARALVRKIERSRDRADVGADVHWLVRDVERIAAAAHEMADGLAWSGATRGSGPDSVSFKSVLYNATHRARVLDDDLKEDFNLEINRRVAIGHVEELARVLQKCERDALRIAHAEAPRAAKAGQERASSQDNRSVTGHALSVIGRALRQFGRR